MNKNKWTKSYTTIIISIPQLAVNDVIRKKQLKTIKLRTTIEAVEPNPVVKLCRNTRRTIIVVTRP